MIASLFALVLAAAVADEPISTSPEAKAAAAAAAPPIVATPAAAPAGPPRDPDIPTSAPEDDYGFVAWCHGALSGHMELHDRVKPELDKVSPGHDDIDVEQAKAGMDYLALYAQALKAAEAASPTAIHERGVQADAAGYRIWAAARNADPRTQMWSYLMWELPPRCEIAAKRLVERSSLFAAALKPDACAGAAEDATVAKSDPNPPEQPPPSTGLRGPK